MNRDFWKGFACGFAAVLVLLAGWPVYSIRTVRAKMDARIEAEVARTRPLTAPAAAYSRAPEVPGEVGRIFYEWELAGMEGDPVSFERFRGKTVLVNLWATWCRPCVAEMPELAALAEEIADEPGLDLVMISDETPELMRRFARVEGVKLPLYTVDSGVPAPLASRARPATFVVDCEGRVVHRREGGIGSAEEAGALLRRAGARCV